MLPPDEHARYARQLLLPDVGEAGQLRLRAARVLLVGVGGLGSPVALYLAAAGVGTLTLVDDDRVDPSNLHRQVLYATSDAGRPKLDAAAARLADLNPHVAVDRRPGRLTAANARALVAGHDVVVDGTDNFAARYAVNDACAALGVPNVYGSVHRFEGQVSVFAAPDGRGGRGPCYRCLYPSPPADGLVPTCAEAGVLGVLPGIVGTLQAAEALKLLLGAGESLAGRLLVVDALAMRFLPVAVPRRPDCPACGEAARAAGFPAVADPPGADACAAVPAEVTPAELAALLAGPRPPQWWTCARRTSGPRARGRRASTRPSPRSTAAALDLGARSWPCAPRRAERARAARPARARRRRRASLAGGLAAWRAAGGDDSSRS
jgi:adenylyltransferase/sulfurtransferase